MMSRVSHREQALPSADSPPIGDNESSRNVNTKEIDPINIVQQRRSTSRHWKQGGANRFFHSLFSLSAPSLSDGRCILSLKGNVRGVAKHPLLVLGAQKRRHV